MSQKQIMTIVVTLVCAAITFAEIQNIRYAKQIDTPTTIPPSFYAKNEYHALMHGTRFAMRLLQYGFSAESFIQLYF